MGCAETLKMYSAEDRLKLDSALIPLAFFPYRYPVAEAPPNYFQLPPVFPPGNRIFSDAHYTSRPCFAVPLIAPAARLLHFALNSIIPLPIPHELARTRQDWLARGITAVVPTKDGLEEFNWGWLVRFPLGPGLGTTSGNSFIGISTNPEVATLPVENVNMWKYDWGVGDRSSHYFFRFNNNANESMAVPTSTSPEIDDMNPRWKGKAPHTCSSLAGPSAFVSKSRRWDADWWRFRLCGNPMRPMTPIPYGRVYEPGSMDGLITSSYLIPSIG